uniref:HAUS augmin like complex subunit 6 n=1 Tax=Astyanax mexicanus TaxID=7994 RepID=A0A8B9RHX9_ASTMX
MMSHLQEANGKYLWWFLQSLEFHLDGSADKSKHLNLGMNMFDKPNKEAFYIVTHFLFKKLNPSRTLDVFRHCWPILNRKHDAEFRKVAFGWLQEIANEEGSSFPKVVASHLLSPSGPRFVNLMLHLAKHVMVKLMKTYTTDGTWVPEAAAVPASNPDLLMKRCQMVKRHFERASVAQDSLIQDYQKRARYLEKSLKISNFRYNGIMILDSVIQGNVDQYALDGKDICVKIPAILLERMERLSHQTSIGSLYEGGQPVLLRLLELLNVVLSILSEERAKVSCPSLQLNQQTLQEQALLMRRSKETLKNMRRNLAKGDIPQTKNTIKKLEVDWEKKWAECLRHTSLISFLNEDPVLDFISPMAPLSFEPATEASFKASIFSQYPAKLPEKTSSKNEDVNTEVDFSRSISAMDKTEDLLFSSCFASPRCTSPYMARPGTPTGSAKAPAFAPTPSPFQTSNGRNFTSQTKTSALKPRAQIMELEYDNLASQFAEAVAMSPLDGRRSGMELEQLLNTLSDPFTTKKQLPRTPESLLMDVRASWRKAVEEGKTEKKHEKKHENDSDSVLRTPSTDLRNPKPVFLSASESVGPLPCSSPPFQQEASAHSTITWDSTQLEALGQNSSNIIELSIAQETFPEMEDDFSFNCGGDELQEVESEREDIELVLPPVILHSPEEAEPALQVARKRLATLGESPFIAACREMEAEVLPSAGRKSFGLSNCSGEKVFSLDLEQLEGFSSPLREELTLPNLVTFSPMDEF